MSEGRPWRRAVAWLAFLGPFFFASYGLANWLASRRDGVGAIAYPWEQWIPFLPWTIVPYWSIDLLYVVSIFICATRRELDRHAQRLLLVQLVSIAFFAAGAIAFGAWINSRLWTRHHPLPAEVIDGVSIGRVPCGGSSGFAAIVDLSAELPCARSASYRNIPILDLTTPSAAVLREAVMAIEEAPRPVLACCALGYSRSAAAVVAWLLETHRAATVDEAMTMVSNVRPSIVLDREVFA